jgi:hypothetical protein
MPVRHASDQALAAFCPTITPRHVGLHRAFINENKLRWRQLGLLLAPFYACFGNVITILLRCVEDFFKGSYSVIC